MKYIVIQESTYFDKYEVEAETEDEAKELVLSGVIELSDTEYVESDLDKNNMQVVEVV